MTEKVASACVQIAAVVRGVAGIRQVHDYAPDNPNAFPVTVVYPGTGSFENYTMGNQRGLHNITIDVLEPQQLRPLATFMTAFTAFIDLVPAALLAEVAIGGDRFTNTIETLASVEYSFIPRIDYAADPMRGYRFILRGVKILT